MHHDIRGDSASLLPADEARLVSGNAAPSVLIVDRSPDSRDVLRTVLQLRGVRTWEASGARQGLILARRHRPTVIVLDLECEAADMESVRDEWAARTGDRRPPLVLLGTAAGWALPQSADRTLRKPYHYGPLIRKIEELLAADDRTSQGVGPVDPADDSREPFAEA